ncbi:MAG: InlB B-repeat-containing protein [Candidatus Methanomethylophilaceae archaeon]|nr:InlB B-repeat-containing protein [Candidatus Methanomethylophilaceae archaeon]
MKHAKNKTIAFGAVLVMCMTAFGVCLTMSDGSDATNGTADNPLTDLTINPSSSGTYYLASGSHLKITGDIVLYEGTMGVVVTVPNTLRNQLSYDGNDSVIWYEGNVTEVGTYTIRYDSCQAIYIEDIDDVSLDIIDTWNVTLIVVSAEYTHTVAYAANGGSGSMSNTVVTDSVNGNSSVTLAANGFTKTGYTFVGWKIGNTIYQPGQTVSVGANATVTATAQWSLNTLVIGGVAQQYVVKGAYGSFTATCSSDPSGASVTYSTSNVPSGLSVNISGSTVTYRYTGSLDSNNQKDLSFTLVASASGYSVNSTTVVNIHVVAQLAFTNSPSAGVIGS